MKITDRYGTVLRCYDNGVRSFDRYTILPPRWAGEHVARFRVRRRRGRSGRAIGQSGPHFRARFARRGRGRRIGWRLPVRQ